MTASLDWRCDECGGTLRDVRSPTPEAAGAKECAGCDRRIEADEAGVWRFAAGFRPPGFTPARRDHLLAIERNHFWFPARHRLLAELVERRGGGGSRALDLGCGSGDFLAHLAHRFELAVGVDAYPESLAVARRHAVDAVLIQADTARVPLEGGQFDLVVALDVLEHVEPAGFLEEAGRLIRPTGRLLLSVPAFPSLWSPLDEKAGHRCRYTRHTLTAELADGGWRLVHHTYYQAALFPLLWLVRRFSTRALRRAERTPSRLLSAPLAAVNALEVRCFGGITLPWGSSLIAVAERAATGESP